MKQTFKIFLFVILFYAVKTYSYILPSEAGCYRLWYMRNNYYANAGYCFKTREALREFGDENCKKNRFGGLLKEDIKEVKLITSYEKKRGCDNKKRFKKSIRKLSKYLPFPEDYHIISVEDNWQIPVRTDPAKSGNIIDIIPPKLLNVKVLAFSKNKKWAFVKYDNYFRKNLSGWIERKYLRKGKYPFKVGKKIKEQIIKELYSKLRNSTKPDEKFAKNSLDELLEKKEPELSSNIIYLSYFRCQESSHPNIFECKIVIFDDGYDGESSTSLKFKVKIINKKVQIISPLIIDLAG